MVSEDVRNGAPELTRSPATRRESPLRRGLLAIGAIAENAPQRLWLAIALSLAIHEIVASLWPTGGSPRKPPEPVAQVVTIERRTPAPTPVPTPKPTPTPPAPTPPPHPSFAPKVVVRAPAAAAITPRRRHAGGRARRRLNPATPAPLVAWVPVAIQTSDAAGVANGGAGTGAGAGRGDSGLGGTGGGAAGSGSGNGGESNAAPCGSVDFVPVHTDTAADGSQAVTVEMDVTLRAGTVERDTLGWRFHYTSVDANPFNARSGDPTVPLQLPPPGYDISQLRPAIAYAIRHTSPEGILAFEPCP